MRRVIASPVCSLLFLLVEFLLMISWSSLYAGSCCSMEAARPDENDAAEFARYTVIFAIGPPFFVFIVMFYYDAFMAHLHPHFRPEYQQYTDKTMYVCDYSV